MKTIRVTLRVGPESGAIVNKLAARYRKETGSEWTQNDVLASAAGLGLREMAKKHKVDFQPLLAVTD